MTEPPAKRAKRTDSAAMRDRNSKPTDTRGKPRESSADGKRRDNRGNDRRGDRDHRYERDDRSRRSRSRSVERIRDRDRNRDRDRRRDRSKSRDRDGKRHVNGDRSRSRDPAVRRRRDGDKRDRERSVSGEGQRSRRDNQRSVSRERHQSRRRPHCTAILYLFPPATINFLCTAAQANPLSITVMNPFWAYWDRKLTHRSKDDPPARRPDRHRTRSRSPIRDPKSSVRTRSPPRGPSTKAPPSAMNRQPHASHSPPPSKGPPTGPKATSPLPKTNGTAPSISKTPAADPNTSSKMDIDEDSDPEVAQMRRMMGFAGFKSTKNTKVPGNNVYAVRKEKKTEYRQYMNRVGGFNRPLSPSR
ncbi:MAG: hypothetical protein LQ346_007132 [Caloplaca aetnensis]|nr:MAG: hypothetical protein LQ346_007132 [Caloplaca aetnensis]